MSDLVLSSAAIAPADRTGRRIAARRDGARAPCLSTPHVRTSGKMRSKPRSAMHMQLTFASFGWDAAVRPTPLPWPATPFVAFKRGDVLESPHTLDVLSPYRRRGHECRV